MIMATLMLNGVRHDVILHAPKDGIFYVIDGTLRQEHLIPTLLACIPVVVGMVVGTLIRGHINEILFRKILLLTLVVIGLNMIRRAVF